MAKKKKHHEEEEAGEAWLLPYSDLMTLLLAVFIVLFAVSQIDQTKADAMANAFGDMLVKSGSGLLPDNSGLSPGGNPVAPPNDFPFIIAPNSPYNPYTPPAPADGDGEDQEANDLKALQEKLDGLFEEAGLEANVSTVIDERGLVVSLQSTVLFDSGKAVLKQENRELLIKTGNALNTINNYIRLEGHTDNVPISSAQYPSNRELSTARANVLAHLFEDYCDISPEKLIAVGYAEYRPIGDNKTAEGRAKNRRVDLVILSSRYNALENSDTYQ
ncbi:MAG: OmpA family protein [Oscillospiraceae bacterium]|jgi:chemotaxis protein MotB|nr:OmpA family protein [Oscillospiraceae bacterium]